MNNYNKELLAPGIVSYQDVMSVPFQFIDKVEQLVKEQKISWGEARSSNGEGDEGKVYKSSRDCWVISLPPFDSNSENIDRNNIRYQLATELDQFLMPCVNDYRRDFAAEQWVKSEGWQILKYGKDHHFVNHFDDSMVYPRTISMSFYLNSNYEGGEIEFGKFNLKIKPKSNQLIMFPSNFMYNHTVHPVTEGIRYAIVGWWN